MVEPVSIVSFLMTERMLYGIRDRAEAGGDLGERPVRVVAGRGSPAPPADVSGVGTTT